MGHPNTSTTIAKSLTNPKRTDPFGYYSNLGVDRQATSLEIRTAYREWMKELHPDRGQFDSQIFQEIQDIYNTLSDPIRRAEYDRKSPRDRPVNWEDIDPQLRNHSDFIKLVKTFVPQNKEKFWSYYGDKDLHSLAQSWYNILIEVAHDISYRAIISIAISDDIQSFYDVIVERGLSVMVFKPSVDPNWMTAFWALHDIRELSPYTRSRYRQRSKNGN